MEEGRCFFLPGKRKVNFSMTILEISAQIALSCEWGHQPHQLRAGI